jgi:purine-binding chemotaxis protein CheW
MSETDGQLASRAVQLRAAFDRSFALPHRTDGEKGEGLLEIRIGREAFALRLTEISGLFSQRKITPIPSPSTALMGVVGFRGNILPVYALHTFFNASLAELPTWLVLVATAPIALAFHRFEGHVQISSDNILPREDSSPAGKYLRDYAQLQSVTRPILHLPTIVDAIRAQSQKSPH